MYYEEPQTALCNALSTSEAEFWKVTVEMTLNWVWKTLHIYPGKRKLGVIHLYPGRRELGFLCLLLHETCISKPHKETTELGKINKYSHKIYTAQCLPLQRTLVLPMALKLDINIDPKTHILIKSRLIILLLTLYLLSGKYFQ